MLLLAAGAGTRLAAGVPKAFVEVGGRTLLDHALDRVLDAKALSHLVVVAPPARLDQARAAVAARSAAAARAGLVLTVVPGGEDRPGSVRAGLAALGPDEDVVLVHDCARPFAPPALFQAVIEAVLTRCAAVVPGVAVPDTLKQVGPDGLVVCTLPRDQLRSIQTPQGFRRDLLERAHAAGRSDVTDDAALVEALGAPVLVIDGDPRAGKITTRADLHVAATRDASSDVLS
ncbi:MAG TPA: 2-C-methyl-D-erythritol 4-phosphate cytidylyltransferase [Dermatophilaceae bacterium]|nr:2-C-methyl-D-erythritol 4-phosphate cytidylyltransferase [Dermatophilaceae bacterium]